MVHFTARPQPSAATSVRPQIASVLSPLLRDRHRQALPVEDRLLAVAVRAVSAGLSASAAFAFASSRDTECRDALSASPHLARHLASEARRYVRAGKSEGHVVELRRQIARRALARLLSSTPDRVQVGAGFDITCRMVFAAIAARALADDVAGAGKLGVMATQPWLGSQLNLSSRQVARALKLLESEYRWIRRGGSGGGGRILWRLPKLDAELNEVALRHWDAIDALAHGRPETHGLAATLSTALHSAWHFSEGELGAAAYLRLLARHAEGGAWLDLRKAPERKARQRLDVWGLRETEPADLPARLDEIAEETLAVFVQQDRVRAAAEESARNRARLDAYRAEREAAYEATQAGRAIVRDLVREHGPVPGRDAVNAWVSEAAGFVRARLDGVVDEAVRVEIGRMLELGGYTEAERGKILAFVTLESGAVGSYA